MNLKIAAIATYLPQNRIASVTLDHLADGTPGRIEKNTGVAFRHHVSAEETVSEMGARALNSALAATHLAPQDLDLLISASGAFDYPIPHNSVLIKAKLTDDRVTFPCFDVDSTCLSFLNALDVAHLYLQSGRYRRIAVVTSEIASKALTPKDEKVFGLFGDAAVAAILETSETSGYQPVYTAFQNFPSGAMQAHVPLGGAVDRGQQASADDLGYFFKMDGKNLIRLTIQHLDGFVAQIETALQRSLHDFDHIVIHQTSKFGNTYFLQHFGVAESKVVETLSQYGNCIAASIPLGLATLLHSDVNPNGKKILLLGSGAGLSLGAIALDFA
ncbi:MAG: ketoacyl-ACP synthase III [Bacteroidetes Order II. Incertae sedis bacterium]|nr:ketoacyl-ACP synthase III [Bacteroidetes Order II. bacterium]